MKLRELRMRLKVMLLLVLIGLVALPIHQIRAEEQSEHVNNTKESTLLVEADADTETTETEATDTDVADTEETDTEATDTEATDTDVADTDESEGKQSETEDEMIPMTTSSLPATGGTVSAGETVVIDKDITGNIIVNGGTLILNDNYTVTGTVHVNNGGSFQMSDGLITGSTDGVRVYGSSTFKMSGGLITGTTNGVRGSGSSTFEMTGDAVISNSYAGVMFSDSSRFEMTGDAVISNNSYMGVSVRGSATFEMTGDAVISNNSNRGVCVRDSARFEMTGDAVISDNPNISVRVSNSSAFKMTGNAVISGRNYWHSLGVVYIAGTSTFEMAGNAVIRDGSSNGVILYGSSIFKMKGNAVISDNNSSGVSVHESGTFEMKGDAIISDNDNVGVRVNGTRITHPATFEMSGNAIISNNSGRVGGGVFVSRRGTFTAISGSIINNTADGDGGGIYTETFQYADPLTNTSAYSNLTISEDVIFSGNTAGNGSFLPPSNATTFLPNIETTSTSIAGISHPLNNYDINFLGPVSSIIYHTVTFNLHGGADEADFPTQTVTHGELSDEPSTNPTRTGYTFEGWFTSSTGNTAFDFEIPITEDTVIHAQWKEIITDGGATTHTVTFNLHGGADEADFPIQTVTHGELSDEPSTNPTRTGYTFEGWFTSSTGNTAFDFDNPITEDTIIHAQWEEIITGGEDTNENNNGNNNNDNNDNNSNNNNNQNGGLPQTGAVAGSALGIGGAIVISGLVIAKKKKLKG